MKQGIVAAALVVLAGLGAWGWMGRGAVSPVAPPDTNPAAPPQTDASAEAPADEGTKPVPGIDVSHYQGDIDWATVKASGVVFAYAKAVQGEGGPDPDFSRNWSAMKEAGLMRGAYDFYDVGEDPAAQAQDYIKLVQLDPGDLPPMVDIETENAGAEANASLVSDLHSYLKTLSEHYGTNPIIYSSPGFWNDHFDDSFSDYPLWVAEYGVSEPKAVTGWTYYTIWQHSQSGSVDGISGNVDLDRFNGTLSELEKFQLQ